MVQSLVSDALSKGDRIIQQVDHFCQGMESGGYQGCCRQADNNNYETQGDNQRQALLEKQASLVKEL